MKLLCVLLNYRTADMTFEALEVAVRGLSSIEDARILVVDNDSQDGSYEKLAERIGGESWPNVELLQTGHNGGFGAGNNFAIRRAMAWDDKPDYVYLLNSDAFVADDAVTTLVEFLDNRAEVGIAGSYIHGPDGDPHITAFRFPSFQSELASSFRLAALNKFFPDTEVPIQPMPVETREVDWLAGASMLIRWEVLEEIGLFDETFFLYFEETDLCRRAKLAGWPTYYVVESKVAHIGSVSTGMKDKSRPMPGFWFDSRRHYFKKNHGKAYLWASNTMHALGLATFKVRAKVQGKKDSDPPRFWRDFVRYNFIDRRP